MIRLRPRLCLGALVAAGVLAVDRAPADAQPATGRVPRSITGIFGGGPPADPNRTRQELTITANMLFGYDDNLAVANSGAPPAGVQAAGYLGDGQFDLEYYRGRAERAFTIRAGAHATQYSEASVGFQSDASINVSGVTRVRRLDQFRVSGIFAYDAYSTLGDFESLEPSLGIDDLPTSTSDARFTPTSSFAGQAITSYSWAAGRNDSVDLDYSFTARRYRESTVETPGDIDTHRAAVAYSRAMGRWLSLRTAYDYSNADAEDRLGRIPVVEHSITAGPVWQRRLSRTRRIEVSVAGGAQHVETVTRGDERETIRYWVPSGSASVRLDLGRTWALWTDYNRGTTVLPQVTTTALSSDTLSVSAGGRLASRLNLSFTTGYARGASDSATGATDDYRSTFLSSQLQWRMGRRFAAVLMHSYYDYAFGEGTNLQEGFLPSSNRHTVRAGVTVWLPLIGRYVGEPRRP
jgi:hypothetical protein